MSWAIAGAVAMAAMVAFGAFGAHGLRDRLSPEALGWWQTAALYHALHGLALFAVAWLADRAPSKQVHVAGVLFAAGILLFSGSLYAMALTGWRRLGMVTPLGGTVWIAGWILLAWSARTVR